jgi:hypothetical protein
LQNFAFSVKTVKIALCVIFVVNVRANGKSAVAVPSRGVVKLHHAKALKIFLAKTWRANRQKEIPKNA